MTTCTCGRIKLGSEVTEARNWNPDCPEHGTESAWWHSDVQVVGLRYDSARLRVVQDVAMPEWGDFWAEMLGIMAKSEASQRRDGCHARD